MVHLRVLLGLLGLCLALPDECDEGECALSFRQLRGQKYESDVWAHEGPVTSDAEAPATAVTAEANASDTPPGSEGTEDPYSKPPDVTDAAPEATKEEPAAPEAQATTPEESPAAASEESPKPASEESPAPASEETPAAATEETPAAATEETPAAATEETPAAATEETPAATTEETPAATTEETPAATTEETPAAAANASTPAAPATAETPAPAQDTVNETHIRLQAEWEDKVGGVCCYNGADVDDICGSCYPAAIADFESKCAAGKWKCDSCGGSWCEPKCVISAQDPNNKCNTAFDSGVVDKTSACGKSHESCAGCGGEWCRTGVKKVANGAGAVNEHTGAANAADAVSTGGFCCYRGSALAKDMCGACEDVSQDINCASSSKCGTCGGHWCAGPRCVMAFSDKADPCHSVYGASSVAKIDDYCNGNENMCINCGGAWCISDDITFANGQKFDPDASHKPKEEDDDSEDSEDEDSEDEDDEEPEDNTFNPIDGFAPLVDLH